MPQVNQDTEKEAITQLAYSSIVGLVKSLTWEERFVYKYGRPSWTRRAQKTKTKERATLLECNR